MKSKFIFLFLFIALIPNVSSNLTLLKGLLNVFSSSNDSSDSANQVHPTVTKLERASLISEDDHKLSATTDSKGGPFRTNLILRLKEMLKRNPIELSEQDRIVNIEDSDEGDNDLGHNNDMDFNHLSNSNSDLIKEHINDNEDAEDEDDDDDEEDSFEQSGFHKKSTKEDDEKLEREANKNDLKIPPQSKIIEELKNSLSAEIRQLAANQSNINGTNISQVAATNFNRTDDTSLSDNTYVYLKKGNQTIASYMGNDASDSNALPTVLNSKLLGTTLFSLEKILGRYKFMNLYQQPSINDTKSDRDLHHKNDDRVVLKANFADHDQYSNTEKSVILGQAPPVQNLTEISFGNKRVKDNLVTSDGQPILKN